MGTAIKGLITAIFITFLAFVLFLDSDLEYIRGLVTILLGIEILGLIYTISAYLLASSLKGMKRPF